MEMKATGILRRVGDFNQIIIPARVRHSVGIQAGDELEVFTCENGVVFRKPDPASLLEEKAKVWFQKNKPYLDAHAARFSIDGDVTICEGIVNNRRVTGIAQCSPEDVFSPVIGMVYACCRAFDLSFSY